MSISVAVATPRTAVRTSPSSPEILKLSNFSSVRLPSELRAFRNQNLCFKPKLRQRTITLVASKDQAFSSIDKLLEDSDKPVLVDFYATWCGPCQYMVPILDQLSTSMVDKIEVVKIDIQKYPAIADEYKVEALPTFILFKDGKQCDRFEGAMVADKLVERIEASLQ